MAELPKAKSRPYRIWSGMKNRCSNTKTPLYKFYGARGIMVSSEWDKFTDFWRDMGDSYKDTLTLDRIDTLKGYSKDNCRWVTMKEQNNNRFNNRNFTIGGVTMTLAQWSDASDVKNSTIRQRYYVYKWPIKRALGMEI